MFKRISSHLAKELGSGNVRMIAADIDGSTLVLYSNHALEGYVETGGAYCRRVPLDEISDESMRELRRKDTRFYMPMMQSTYSSKGLSYTSIECRKPDPAETGILSSGTSYAYCRTPRLARI